MWQSVVTFISISLYVVHFRNVLGLCIVLIIQRLMYSVCIKYMVPLTYFAEYSYPI